MKYYTDRLYFGMDFQTALVFGLFFLIFFSVLIFLVGAEEIKNSKKECDLIELEKRIKEMESKNADR